MKKLKWLFVVLVLLNVSVFLYLSRLSEPSAQEPAPHALQEVNADKLNLTAQTSEQVITSEALTTSAPQVQSSSEPTP